MEREVTPHTMSQNEKILKHLKKHSSITAREAVIKFECYRLSARIDDLRRKGINIKTEMCTRKNEAGHAVNYAKYILVEE